MIVSLGRSLATDSSAPSARRLYRELFRQIKQLPKQTQLYYRNYARQHFTNWDDETDAEVLKQLHDKARQDAAWVLKKYAK